MRLPLILILAAAFAAASVIALRLNETSAASSVTLETGCTPEAVRPAEFALVSCTATVTNTADDVIHGARIQLLPPSQLRITFPYHFDQRLDGALLSNQTNGVNVSLEDIAPSQSRTLEIRFIAAPEVEGEYGLEFQVSGAGQVTGDRIARFAASADASEPATALDIELVLMDQLTPLPPPLEFLDAPLPQARYELRITNRSQDAIDSLTATMRFQEGRTTVIGPPPSGLEDLPLGLVTWDLAAFGRTSLAPGEVVTTVVDFSWRPGECSYVAPLAIVESAAGASVAPPTPGVPIGTCEVVDDQHHACFFFGLGPTYPVSCEESTRPCYPPDATQFEVPENGIVCISTVPLPATPQPTEPAPTPSPALQVIGLPSTGLSGARSDDQPWALVVSSSAAALAFGAIALSIRKRGL